MSLIKNNNKNDLKPEEFVCYDIESRHDFLDRIDKAKVNRILCKWVKEVIDLDLEIIETNDTESEIVYLAAREIYYLGEIMLLNINKELKLNIDSELEEIRAAIQRDFEGFIKNENPVIKYVVHSILIKCLATSLKDWSINLIKSSYSDESLDLSDIQKYIMDTLDKSREKEITNVSLSCIESLAELPESNKNISVKDYLYKLTDSLSEYIYSIKYRLNNIHSDRDIFNDNLKVATTKALTMLKDNTVDSMKKTLIKINKLEESIMESNLFNFKEEVADIKNKFEDKIRFFEIMENRQKDKNSEEDSGIDIGDEKIILATEKIISDNIIKFQRKTKYELVAENINEDEDDIYKDPINTIDKKYSFKAKGNKDSGRISISLI
ncbi:MAG: hypothetical protein U0354_19830 [Candidatus Sericytochromatia bacterium]